jgi:very-short-patch-repair endonuclease
MIAHPTPRPAAKALHKPPQGVARPAETAAQEAIRLETARTEREKHEHAYFIHVVCPLAVQGYPIARWQVRNIIPGRRFVMDYAYIEAMLAIEIHGQIWRKGGHTSGYGVTRDAAKANELACIGWRLLVFTPEQIASGEAHDWTERALRAAGFRTMTR